jgi:hypothetical protein
MSKKISALAKPASKEFTLTQFETAYIKDLEVLLQYHVARQQIISNFVTYIAMTRLGYTTVTEGYDLRFDLNLDRDPAIVLLREIKKEA